MADNIDRYVPEFDEAEMRSRLADCSRDELMDMLMRSYKEKRIIAKMFDELSKKLNRIHLVP
jgi:phosphopantothenate synthetase